MASFSFGAGNAGKLARIPLYALGRLATLLIPRTSETWVFSSAAGIADGALALCETARAAGERTVWLTGSASEAQDAAARGFAHVPKHSARGFWLTARARVVVVTHGFGDANRYAVGGAYVVQLWHGIPLKRIGLDSPETLRSSILPRSRAVRALLAFMYRSATARIGLVPAASELVRGRLESAFALPAARVPVTGEPRADVLSRGTVLERRARARAEIAAFVGPVGDGALVLYAPTWRDGAEDPAVPTASEWTEITGALTARDAVMLVRSHPLGAGSYDPPAATDRVRMLGADLVADVTPLLPGIDALITDYSSLVFDAALAGVPSLFLAPDVAAYAESRGFYGTYAQVAGDDVASDWSETVSQLDALLGDENVRSAREDAAGRLSARMHAHRDGRNTERVYRAIRAGIGGSDAAKGAA